MKVKLTRKSRDGLGVVIWWYDNGWRIIRSPERPHSYAVETIAPGRQPYHYAGKCGSLAAARYILAVQTPRMV